MRYHDPIDVKLTKRKLLSKVTRVEKICMT